MDGTLLTAGLSAGSALGGAAIASLAGWRKSAPESEQIAVNTLRDVIGVLRSELERKEHELEEMHKQVNRLDRELEKLISDPPHHLA